jgi:hypothetical protein
MGNRKKKSLSKKKNWNREGACLLQAANMAVDSSMELLFLDTFKHWCNTHMRYKFKRQKRVYSKNKVLI